MTNIYVPATSLDDWRKRLADPEKHWQDGYSAKLTASSWQSSHGFPAHIAAAFKATGDPFSSFTPLLIFPEHQVAIPPLNGHPTQADVWVLASHPTGLASIAVEGKKDENFGPTLDEWLLSASSGKDTRLAFLTSLLGLPANLPGTTRYQFLHRAAGAVVEAKRFRADVAVSLVQSFSNTSSGLADFINFVGLFGQSVNPGGFVLLGQLDGISLYAGWVQSVP